MQVSRLSWVERVFVVWALALASVAVLTVLVALGVWISDNSSNVASWVQAVGSIAAIVAGFGVARFQLNEQRREQRARDAETERQKKRRQCALLFEHYASLVAIVQTAIEMAEEGTPLWTKARKDLTRIGRVLDGLGVEDFAEAEDFWNAAHISQQISFVLEMLGDDPEITFENSAHREAVDTRLRELAEAADSVSEEIGDRLNALTTSSEFERVRIRTLAISRGS